MDMFANHFDIIMQKPRDIDLKLIFNAISISNKMFIARVDIMQ